MKQNLLLAFFFLISFNCFSQDTLSKKTLEEDDPSITFTEVEQAAQFPGGEQGWRLYLQRNLNGNVPIDNKARDGIYTVIVKFIVSKNGSISDVTAETNFGHGMEAEVIRVIKKGPKWIPAMQNGKMVNAFRRQPVTFVVQTQ